MDTSQTYTSSRRRYVVRRRSDGKYLSVHESAGAIHGRWLDSPLGANYHGEVDKTKPITYYYPKGMWYEKELANCEFVPVLIIEAVVLLC